MTHWRQSMADKLCVLVILVIKAITPTEMRCLAISVWQQALNSNDELC